MRDEGRGTKLVIYKCIVNTGFSLIPNTQIEALGEALLDFQEIDELVN
jgi:hypothetical protein